MSKTDHAFVDRSFVKVEGMRMVVNCSLKFLYYNLLSLAKCVTWYFVWIKIVFLSLIKKNTCELICRFVVFLLMFFFYLILCCISVGT